MAAHETKPELTAAGLALVWGSGILLVWGGIRFDGFFLLLGALGVGLLVVSRGMVRRNLEGIVLERSQAREVFAGDKFSVEFTFRTGNGFWGRRRLRFRDGLVCGGTEGVFVDEIPQGAEVRANLEARLYGRGNRIGRQYELVTRFPGGLFEAIRRMDYGPGKAGGLIVFPQPILPASLRHQLDQAVLESARQSRGDGDVIGELRGVRVYQPGDPLKGIHWPSSARSRQLMVREWEPPQPRPTRLGLLFHSIERPGDIIRLDRFERSLQIVSGFLRYCQELSIPVKLLLAAGPESGPDQPKCLEMPGKHPFRTGFEALAFARRRGMRGPEALALEAGELADCDHLFVVGDSPVKHWRGRVASGNRTVVCVDPDSVAVEPRKLSVRARKSG